MTDNIKKIAILFDGDNAEATLVEPVLNEVARFGRVTIKRIYADFTTPQMHNWKQQLNVHAIRPVQKFAYTKGKNSSDSALIIDAMDILHAGLVDGFCIVSSDSDYTGIANRIREQGLFIMGIGTALTPVAFVKACESFTYTEILQPGHNTRNGAAIRSLTNIVTQKPVDIEMVSRAFDMVSDVITGQALASQMGIALKKIDPTFDCRNYGYSSLRKFLDALKPHFEVLLHDDHMTISVRRGNGVMV